MEDKNMFTNVIKQISNSMIENMSKSLTDGFKSIAWQEISWLWSWDELSTKNNKINTWQYIKMII